MRVETMERAVQLPDDREAALEPESVLPGQLDDGRSGSARLQPEKRLQLAVLEDAILTFERTVGVAAPRARRLLAEVDAWFASDTTDWPFAFVTICHTLDLDPDYIRRGMRCSRARLNGVGQRRPRYRRDANGTRHQVVLYVTASRRTA
jgi:hypothetical protein